MDSGFEPGFSETDTSVTAAKIGNVSLPVTAAGAPLTVIGTTGPTSHTQTLFAVDPNVRTPYVQNFNFSIQRAINQSTSFTVSYVGSKGTKLVRSIDTNESNIYSNGLLQAFQTVQAGGDSPLIDQIFANLPGAAGTAVTAAGNGSNYVRGATSSTFTFLANNNPGGFANYINTTNLSGVVGGMLSHAGLPANFIVANPQFLSTYLTGNFGSSTYHSLQAQVSKRFSRGLSIQGSYVWSKALGEDDGQSSTLQANYRTLRNRAEDKQLLSFDHRGVLKANGIYELPFGRGKTFAKNANGFLDRIIGGWQMGAIFNKYTGSPFSVNAQNTITNFNTIGLQTPYTPQILGSVPDTGVTKLGGYVTYFPGLTQITDPSRTGLTTLGGLNTRSTLLAIAGANGAPLLVNPAAGQMGNLGLASFTGPGSTTLDINLIKRIRVNERFNFQIGATATNALNTPQFANPLYSATLGNNLNINSTNFGRITTSATGPRILVLQGRINF
jgi:hypothetical protein